jgi:hypothetical protein
MEYAKYTVVGTLKRRGVRSASMPGGITTKAVADVVRTVQGLPLEHQEALVDRIYAAQPHILLTVLALSRDGVPEDMWGTPAPADGLHVCVVSQCPDAYEVNYLLERGIWAETDDRTGSHRWRRSNWTCMSTLTGLARAGSGGGSPTFGGRQ